MLIKGIGCCGAYCKTCRESVTGNKCRGCNPIEFSKQVENYGSKYVAVDTRVVNRSPFSKGGYLGAGGHPSLQLGILCAAGIPESLVPVSMLITRYLAISHGGSNTLVAKVFLQKPQTVTGTIKLYGMDSKGITQPVRADTSNSSCLTINQLVQSCPGGTVFDY